MVWYVIDDKIRPLFSGVPKLSLRVSYVDVVEANKKWNWRLGKIMKFRPQLLIILICSVLAGCAQTEKSAEVNFQTSGESLLSLELPATFTGQIPCPDCQRVDITLNLRPDFIYQLRKTYQVEQGEAKIESQMGRWRYSPEGNLIVLGKQKGLLKTYAILSNDRLHFLELESQDVELQAGYDLIRSLELDAFEDIVKMRGMYRLANGSAVLRECSSGKTFPVGRDGDYQSTAKAYMNVPHNFGEPLLVSVTGKLVRQTSNDATTEEEIIVEHFKRFYSNQDCEGKEIRANLTGTYWQLVELDGQAVETYAVDKLPYLMLGSDKTLTGFSGCNKLKGTYLAKGDLFLVKREKLARIACRDGVKLENLFLQVLDQSESFRIAGGVLQLRDQNEQVLAAFQAGP